ncbi:MAG: hypothetical protein IKP59_01220 [Prevotella sp.]|jgi:hypothetical protein|nr:hypothetical protein [Prevotella sp.]
MRRTFLRLFSLSIMIMMSVMASAAEYSLVVNRASGGQNIFALSQEPVIAFFGNKMRVTTSAGTVHIPLVDVTNYVFKDATGIEGVKADEGSAILEDGQVVFTQIGAGQNVSVVTPNGVSVLTTSADAQGKATVNLKALPKGIYIVKSPKNSIKVINQ